MSPKLEDAINLIAGDERAFRVAMLVFRDDVTARLDALPCAASGQCRTGRALDAIAAHKLTIAWFMPLSAACLAGVLAACAASWRSGVAQPMPTPRPLAAVTNLAHRVGP